MAAMEHLGITVHQETAEMQDKHVTPQACAACVTNWIVAHSLAFVFSINFFPAISYTCEHFHVPYVCWVVDSPVPELFSRALFNDCNRVFLFDRAQYEYFAPHNPGHIFHLPLASDSKRWSREILAMTEEEEKKYAADAAFVGSLYSEKCRYDDLLRMPNALSEHTQGYVDGLLEAQLRVNGYNLLYETLPETVIDEIASADPNFYGGEDMFIDNRRYVIAHQYLGMKLANMERVRLLSAVASRFDLALYTNSDPSQVPNARAMGTAKTLTEMPRIFHTAKINLNITIRPIEKGLSLRIWDVLACGGFLLTNAQAELPDYFSVGEDLVVYEDEKDLLSKIDYYLRHEDERLQIALNGYEKTAALHTWEIRLAQMFKILTT